MDSTTWAKHARVWQLLLPRVRKGEFDYGESPLPIQMSPRGKKRQRTHVDFLSPTVRGWLLRYLEENGEQLGEYVVEGRPAGHKPLVGEFWLDKGKRSIVRETEPGAKISTDVRMKLNARLYRRAAKEFGIRRFYFSGISGWSDWMSELKSVLLTFNKLPKGCERWLSRNS